MRTQLEKEPEKKKNCQNSKKNDSESAIRNINDTQKNKTNFSKVEKGQKGQKWHMIH